MKYILICFLLLLMACNNTPQEKVDQRAEVMKIHDDAMAKIGLIQTRINELEELSSNSSDSLVMREVITLLEEAEEEMMLWMQDYKEPEEGLDSFYASEKKKIKVVSDKIDNSLEKANNYVKN